MNAREGHVIDKTTPKAVAGSAVHFVCFLFILQQCHIQKQHKKLEFNPLEKHRDLQSFAVISASACFVITSSLSDYPGRCYAIKDCGQLPTYLPDSHLFPTHDLTLLPSFFITTAHFTIQYRYHLCGISCFRIVWTPQAYVCQKNP